MNREQRRRAARSKDRGQNYADVLAKRQIGKETLRMAMEDEAVKLASDILCQRQLWAVIVALNEQFQFGAKRTIALMEAMDKVLAEFEDMKKKNGNEYAEEKLRQRASQVSGVQVKYQHEAEKETWKQMQKEKDGDHDL